MTTKKSAFAGSFADLQAARGVKMPAATKGVEIQPPVSETGARPLRKKGNPEFDQVTIYIRKETHIDAWRKWQDAGGKEFSELAEKLFAEYVGG